MDFVWWLTVLLLVGSGIFRILKPEESIWLQNHWRSRDFEPTENYVKAERFGGVIQIIIAAIIIFVVSII